MDGLLRCMGKAVGYAVAATLIATPIGASRTNYNTPPTPTFERAITLDDPAPSTPPPQERVEYIPVAGKNPALAAELDRHKQRMLNDSTFRSKLTTQYPEEQLGNISLAFTLDDAIRYSPARVRLNVRQRHMDVTGPVEVVQPGPAIFFSPSEPTEQQPVSYELAQFGLEGMDCVEQRSVELGQGKDSETYRINIALIYPTDTPRPELAVAAVRTFSALIDMVSMDAERRGKNTAVFEGLTQHNWSAPISAERLGAGVAPVGWAATVLSARYQLSTHQNPPPPSRCQPETGRKP